MVLYFDKNPLVALIVGLIVGDASPRRQQQETQANKEFSPIAIFCFEENIKNSHSPEGGTLSLMYVFMPAFVS